MAKNKQSTIHDRRYQSVIHALVQMRKELKVPQSHLAVSLGLSQSDISKIERCDRRMDLIELVDYVHALCPDSEHLVLTRIFALAANGEPE